MVWNQYYLYPSEVSSVSMLSIPKSAAARASGTDDLKFTTLFFKIGAWKHNKGWCKIVFCYQNCYKIVLEKMKQVWIKIFFKITEVEKEHQGRDFWGQGHFWGQGGRPRPRNEGQGQEMLLRCAFSTKVTWKHCLFIPVIFSNRIGGTILITDCFFAQCRTFLWVPSKLQS